MSEISFATNLADARDRIIAIQELILTTSQAYTTPGQRTNAGPFWTNSVRSISAPQERQGADRYQIVVTIDMTLHYAGVTEGDPGVVDNLLMWTVLANTTQYFIERRLLQYQAAQAGVNSMNALSISDSGRRTLPDGSVGTVFTLSLPFNLTLDQAY